MQSTVSYILNKCTVYRSTKFDVSTGGVKKSLPKIFVGLSVGSVGFLSGYGSYLIT